MSREIHVNEEGTNTARAEAFMVKNVQHALITHEPLEVKDSFLKWFVEVI